ncbi:hypothetical protein N7539_005614 [Penicillium diatomitis]|uniref:Uncharacterized protein n=1 Tax=Penicillium diatomitis TaxID=2819901 RepID=A0A9X0BV83_9EURO|nr:uncharacterized protein N7539_005614 [Penicillium diatomitis]KAJ5485626.1 hypothetical protein N7539_005614 [Penicillium diatomitis]
MAGSPHKASPRPSFDKRPASQSDSERSKRQATGYSSSIVQSRTSQQPLIPRARSKVLLRVASGSGVSVAQSIEGSVIPAAATANAERSAILKPRVQFHF